MLPSSLQMPPSRPRARTASPSAMASVFYSHQLSESPMGMAARPSLSTSLTDFALPYASPSPSSLNSPSPSVITQSKDDSAAVKRLRRPTLSGVKSVPFLHLNEARVHSPLATSLTISPKKGKRRERGVVDITAEDTVFGAMDDADSPNLSFRDKDRIVTDSSSPSSESDIPTPPMRLGNPIMEELTERPKSSPMDTSRSASPGPSTLKLPAEIQDPSSSTQRHARRLSYPIKQPRLQLLRAEAHPEDIEVKSEAQFQRLVASFSDLPPGLGPRSSASNRGRFPEEVLDEDEHKEDTSSDDGEVDDSSASVYSSYKPQGGSEPINITKMSTPAQSMRGSPEDTIGGVSESPGGSTLMDVDTPSFITGSPFSATAMPPQQWRQTPPPTTAAVRTNKRKHDDRYEPYAPTSKRRAVSPSITALHMHHTVSPIVIPRSPVLRPRGSFSQSQANSAASSPTISHSSSQYILNSTAIPNSLSYTNGNGNGSYQGHHRSGSSSSVVSSPTVRSSMALASPILRPVPRLAVGMKRGSAGDMDGEKILDGAGEAVGSLSLGR